MSRAEGGMDTTRLTAAEQDRIWRLEREAKARRYLLRRGMVDVAEILGLVEPAQPSPTRRSHGRVRAGVL